MTKEEIYTLIEEMNDDTQGSNSVESISWNAHRKAEKMSDSMIFPLLKEIIEENDHKQNVKKRNIRNAAYFIGGKVLQNNFNHEFCTFYIDRLSIETNKYVLSSMLDRLSEFDIKGEFNIEPILVCVKSDKWQIRYSAINALGSFDTFKSKECLRVFVQLEDEKEYSDEIIYAQAALGRIGETEDIELLDLHVNSKKRDVKISAQFAQERLKKKMGVGG